MDNKIEQISREEVSQVLEYASTAYSALRNAPNHHGDYNSQLENKVLKGLNNDSRIPNERRIFSALTHYSEREEELISYNQFMNTWDSLFNKVVEYYVSMMSFNWYPYCINAQEEEYASDEYKEDLNRVYDFFNNFNIKEEFKIVLHNMLLNDSYFCWLRDSSGSFGVDDSMRVQKSKGYSLQMMPQSRCEITGKFTGEGASGYLWDFDLSYFYDSNVRIENFDPSLVKMFKQKIGEENLKSFITSKSDLNKTNGYYGSSYARTLVNKGAWAFKFNQDSFNNLPPFSHLLNSCLNNSIIESLQKDKDFISANAIILGEIKTHKDDKAARDKSPFTIPPKQLGQLMKYARDGIDRNIKQIALPTQDNKLFQFSDSNINMLDTHLSTTAGQAVSANSMIYSTGKMAQFELQSALNRDFQFVARAYSQFENFLNFFVNKKTKEYKFRFRVGGSSLPFMRDAELERLHKTAAIGIQVGFHKWASALDMQPQELQALMEEFKYTDGVDKLQLLLNTNTKDDGTDTNVGRPESDSEVASIGKEYV